MRKLILKCGLSPGDIVTLTAAVRDLHLARPGEYLTDVRTPCPALWENNPHITRIEDNDPDARVIAMEYPLIHRSNREPVHFVTAYTAFLAEQLGHPIPPSVFKGDIHLSDQERGWLSQAEEAEGKGARFWIIVSGGKMDFTAKWWDPERWQAVVDHFKGRIRFVQVGEAGHKHPALRDVLDLRGKTDLRQLVRLVHHADGVLCPVTSLMHLAAAVPWRHSGGLRPCVVVAGGREPSHWERYPGHRYLDTIGQLPCCDLGGCWKSRVVPLGDGDAKDKSLCERPVLVREGVYLPACLDRITADDVIRAVGGYLAPVPEKAEVKPKKASCCGDEAKPDEAPAQWGPRKWREFHGRTADSAKDSDPAVELAWLERFAEGIPCEECRRSFTALLQSDPPRLRTADEYRTWQIDIHNAVNAALGKPVLSRSAAERAIESNRATTGEKLRARGQICLKCEHYQQATATDGPLCRRDNSPLKPKMSAGQCDKWPGYVPPPGPFTLAQLSPAFRDVEAAPTNLLPASAELVDKSPDAAATSFGGKVLRVKFHHGLGDHAHFAANIVMAREDGYSVVVESGADKHPILLAAGAEVGGSGDFADVDWHDPFWNRDASREVPVWEYNKSAVNLSRHPMPELNGNPREQWDRFRRVKLSADCVSQEKKARVDALIANLPRPIVLLHTCGNTWQEVKKLPPKVTEDLCDTILDGTEGSVVLLDWDNRTPRTPAWRVRHSQDDWGGLCLAELMYLTTRADLLIGVDSGPLHVAGIMGCPTVAVWPHHEVQFSKYLVPRDNQVSMVSSALHGWCQSVRNVFNVVEYRGDITGAAIGAAALSMLAPRYLPDDKRGTDSMLQHWIRDWQRTSTSPLTRRGDRDVGFDYVLREMRGRVNPVAVETGCARMMDDWGPWGGAGFSTYLLGVYLRAAGGRLVSMDIDAANCALAKAATDCLGVVDVQCVDSVLGLSRWVGSIDLLLLDSWDTNVAGFAEHALREVRAIESRLCEKTILIFDDTVYSAGRWHGKGALAVPYLLSRGWRIAYSGLQAILRLKALDR